MRSSSRDFLFGCTNKVQHFRSRHIETRGVEMRERHAPGLAHGGIAAGHGHVVEMSEALEAVEARNQHFPAPDAAVRAVAGAIEREADDRPVETVFGHAAGDVSMMMLNPDQRQAARAGPLLRPRSREIAGMQIVHDRLGLNFEGAHQVVESVLEKLQAGEVFEIAEMLALVGVATASQRKHALEMAADGEQRRRVHWQVDGQRYKPARSADDLRARHPR